MSLQESRPGSYWLYFALLSESLDNLIHGSVMDFNVQFLQLISDPSAPPEWINCLHLKNQFLDGGRYRFPSSFLALEGPPFFNETSLPFQESFWLEYRQV